MKVLINASNIHVGGGAQVALSFISFLSRISEHQFLVLASTKILAQLDKDELSDNVTVFQVDFGFGDWLKGKGKNLDNIESEFNPDVVFTIFGPSYWTPKSKHLMGFALPWLINPNSKAFRELGFKRLLKKRAQNFIKGFFTRKNSKHFVVETEDVKQRLLKYFDIPLDNTWVVDNTYNQNFNDIEVLPSRASLTFRFVTITANYPHKNLRILKSVVPILKERGLKVSFLLTIPDEEFRVMFGEQTDVIKNVGPISSKECPIYYNKADALFLPTLLECFTASYPEAMIMKRPILTSNLSFAKQICGEGNALFFEPLDPKDVADKIEQIVTDQEKYDQLVDNGLNRVKDFLTFDQRASRYLEILEDLSKN